MSEAISVTYDARHPEARPGTARSATIRPIRDAKADRQAREDRPFYVPDFLSGRPYDENREARDAAAKHAKHLRKAQSQLDDALNLVRLMASSIAEDGDSRAMQIETGLTVVETRVNKALNRLDRHNTRHEKLFLAYVDLKNEADGDKE